MRRFLCLFSLLLVSSFQILQSQSQEVQGLVIGSHNVENIHVINQTSQNFSITNSLGEFKIPAKLYDTLVFSSIQYKKQILVVSTESFNRKPILVFLEDAINELEEVIIGKILSGDLENDISIFDVERNINFYDVGVPGYIGKKKTQSERLLNEATTGAGGRKLKWYSPLTGYIPINPIINGLTGRTKILKHRLKLEEKDELLHKIKSNFYKDFFALNPLNEDLKMDFFYFCAEDENFLNRCKDKTDLEVFIYLNKKYDEYQANLKENKD